MNFIRDYKEQREYRPSSSSTQTNAYVQAMRALQDKIKIMEVERANKIQDYEKLIDRLRSQLDEKEKMHLKALDEIQSSRSQREDQLSKKIQDLLNKNNELQLTIHQQTIDYKDLSMKYQQLKLKLDYDDKERNYYQPYPQRKISQLEDQEQHGKGMKNLNLELLSPSVQQQMTSPRYVQDQSLKHNAIKQVIKDCLEDMKHTTPFQPTQSNIQQSNQVSQRKKMISPPYTNRNFDQEMKIKQLNDRYELLIRQAQKENDFKQKAIIRKELLEIAEQIKEANRQKN